MTVTPLEVLLALKVISFVPGLVENDRRVAATLLEHFNRKTSECDPSLDRIAKLLDVSTRTVIRSTKRLEKAELFRKERHGGHLNRNSYQPVWPKFREIEGTWKARFSENARSRRSQLSHVTGQRCHVKGDASVIQTCGSNLPKETCSGGRPRPGSGQDFGHRRTSGPVRATSSADAARVAAERRWAGDLHQRFSSQPVTYGEIIDAIDLTLQEAATDAELRRRGSGMAHIIHALGIFTGVRAPKLGQSGQAGWDDCSK